MWVLTRLLTGLQYCHYSTDLLEYFPKSLLFLVEVEDRLTDEERVDEWE